MRLSNKEISRIRKKYGKWAVITGASSGIGLALARGLAKVGLNLIINSRNHTVLKEISSNLKEIGSIQVIPVASDVGTSAGIEEIISVSKGKDVGLFIPSAGYGTSGLFIDSSIQNEINMLRANCEAVLSLTHYYSQIFSCQKRGGIILLSSIVAFQGVPYAAHYAATKAYIQSLAEALSIELKPYKVDVLAAAPAPVSSGFGKRANMRMNKAMKPEELTAPILKALGRKTFVLPGWLSKVLTNALSTVPRSAKVHIMKKVMGGFTQHQRELS